MCTDNIINKIDTEDKATDPQVVTGLIEDTGNV